MGCLGTGAVGAGLIIGRLRARVGLEPIVAWGCVIFALAMVVSAFVPWALVVYAFLVLGGGAWMAVMSTFNTATQTSVPPWVRARALAMHTLCALGSFAFGSAFWGAVSDLFGLSFALCVAAATMAAGMALAKHFPLRMGDTQEVTPGIPTNDIFVPNEPPPEAGPVAIEISYRIRADESAAFMDTVRLLRAPRRRDGATFWRIYRDLADPSRFVERFIVTSWADYLHQRARATLADQELEAHVRTFLLEGESVQMTHYLAEA
jgi:MFS family permease